MTEIERLALAERAARITVEGMAMSNIYGQTVEQQEALAVAYAEARRAHYLAKLALEAAIKAPPEETAGKP